MKWYNKLCRVEVEIFNPLEKIVLGAAMINETFFITFGLCIFVFNVEVRFYKQKCEQGK